jgi:nucleoside-diphosphate-sugar epimerase
MQYMSKILMADIYEVISDSNIPWHDLIDCVVLVTGATGLVGSALVRALSAASERYDLNVRLIAHGRNEIKGEMLVRETGAKFKSGDISKSSAILNATDKLEYVFHCAAITKSVEMINNPVDIITTEFNGTWNMLELAREKHCKGFVYLSSMEVYGQTGLHEVRESDLGYLDLSSSRSCYPESKRLCEILCNAYAAQYGLPVKIARLTQTFGAGTPKDDTRVFAQFARNAVAEADIELHTEGKSRGNYCYISDTVRGLLTILLKGKAAEAYNISNPAVSVTVREMAEMVARDICDRKIGVVYKANGDTENRRYATDVSHIISADKLKSLGWSPKYKLDEMYRRMIADWQSIKS